MEQIEPKELTTANEKKQTNYGDQLFLHCTHEKRFHSTKRQMHQVYDNVFQNTPTMNLNPCRYNRPKTAG
jgi:hypothetical protein